MTNKSQWSYELFGVECGEGWKSLYQPLIDYIEGYNNKHTDSFFEIHQIKEKWGGLRFYWGGENIPKDIEKEFKQMVDDAEAESWLVCEQCGSTENVGLVVGSWYYTTCEKCLREQITGEMKVKWRCDDKLYIIDKNGKTEQTK